MTDTLFFQLNDLMIHKQYIISSGLILVNYLYNNNQKDLAIELVKRISVHDNSKLESEELNSLIQIPYDLSIFKNPKEFLSDNSKEFIKMHWEHNSHHPEHYKNFSDMTELDIMEMVCDWYARSKQFNTDFLSFVKERQKNRFHFSEKQFEKIFNYCLILNQENLKNTRY